MPWRPRLLIAGRGLLAGACIAAALPPWGWWPLAFLGVAQWDRLLAGASARERFTRTWFVGVAWFLPSMLWMWDLTAPGYLVAVAAYSAYFGLAAAAVPPGRARWLALPGAVVLAELAKWSFPFGGVPLSNLAMTQVDTPLLDAARLAGPLLVVALVVVGGVALSAAWERAWRPALACVAALAVVLAGSGIAPRGEPDGELRVALVQGGGEQRTRAEDTDEREVFERHLAASELIEGPVDLVVWPENVVSVEGELVDNDEHEELQDLARRLDATVVAGVTEGISDDEFLNASVVYAPDGTLVDRYDKVRTVPFGEFVPLRPLIEAVAGDSGIPRRDARPGTGPAVVDTPVGELGVVISWEVFFANRARDAIGNGGSVLLNPTNGSSYWLTQVQTQQVASSKLRAVETGRWVLQAAPTGFSALVTPEGEVVERSRISEQRVIQGTIQERRGDTVATMVGPFPLIALSLAAIAGAWFLQRRAGDRVAVADEGTTTASTTPPPTTATTTPPPRSGPPRSVSGV
ncbi:MAG: apolipoprotein N-acyltransferase [Acidimicrobiales bacterium]|jgi:apolipoprotein N-acyltransferase|nr:apolipoprotein N-acyltransferase [Acidimicrobiales bacterium]